MLLRWAVVGLLCGSRPLADAHYAVPLPGDLFLPFAAAVA